MALITRLRQAVSELEIQGLPHDARLAFCAGVVPATPGSKSVDEMIARADKALYQAKEEGGSRSILVGPTA